MTRRYFFSPCTLGLEEILEQELRDLGAGDLERDRGGVHWSGDTELGYRANIWLRTAIRVQELLAHRRVRDNRALYQFAADGDWVRLMDADQTLAVDATVRDSFLTHSGYAGQLVKDAIVDQFRDRLRRRPSVDRKRPDLPLKLLLRNDEAFLYRDWTGDSLHKRGYRPIQVRSPLAESTAAGLLLLAGWDRATPIIDPMCGSATILIEAAFLAGDRAPGLERSFACQRWPEFEPVLFRRVVADARRRAEAGRASIPRLFGADRHPGALELAQRALRGAGLERVVTTRRADLADLEAPFDGAIVVTNPPYGERIGEGDDLERSWRDLGEFLRRSGARTAYVLSGNKQLTTLLRLRSDRRWPVQNGPIDCRLLRYELGVQRDAESLSPQS